ASATFVLLTPGEAAAAFARRDKQVNGGTLRLVLDAPFDNLPYWMFNNDDLSGWEVLETGNNGAKWRIQEGDLRQIARIDFATYVVYKKDFQDLAFTAELSTDTKSSIGLIFGFQDGRNYYRFALNLEQGQCELVKVRDGRATMLEQIQYAIETRRRYSVTVRSERAGARSHLLSPKAGERVRIMIDGQELIEHVDQSNPFTKGRVGLYCQGNPGARFGGVQVYQYGPARRPQYGEYPDPAWLMAYHPTFSKAADPVHDPDDPAHDLLKSAPFDDFDATSLAALPVPSAAASGVLVGADVKVLEDQVFRVLGYLFADGTFSLTSTTGIEPLRLSVAGIQVELALAVKGRLMLTGRAQGAQSYSQVTAKVWGSWEPLPNIIELNVGRKTKPLDLTVDSNGRFSVRGGSQLKLFGGAANLDGEVDVSHTHCFVHGTFTYTSKAEHKIGKQHIVELSLAAAGRIGPGNQIELSGAGNLKILGKIVRNVQGRISDKGIMVDAQFKTSNWNWNGILIKKFSAALQGVIDFNKTGPPNLVFAGDCYLRLFGASNSVSRLEISGRGGIRTDDVHLTTFVEGKMFWQGRQWLQGRLLLHSQTGVHLEGQAHFGFLLSPREVGGIRVASLIFRINLGGTVRISPNGSVSCNLRLEWDLGVNLPGAEKQILPVASNVTHVTGALDRPIVLANLDGFRLLPLQGLALSLPIPEITGIGDPVMKIGTKNGIPAIFMQGLGTLYFDDQPFMNGLTAGTLASLTGGTLPSLSPGNFPTLEFNMGIPYLDGGDLPTLDPGSFPAFHAGSLPEAVSSTIPVPSFSQGEHFDAGSTRTPIHEAYTLDWAQETIPINLETFAHAPISFGIDQENYKFYLQIAGRKYALTGRPILQ
ncbi:MAG: hypothetical protein H3C34_10335, partial [Caldilineaceae bacterium]|nr:hypothetical protein [Caldilineaceae bacterium]